MKTFREFINEISKVDGVYKYSLSVNNKNIIATIKAYLAGAEYKLTDNTFSFKNKDDYDTIKNDFKKYISEGVDSGYKYSLSVNNKNIIATIKACLAGEEYKLTDDTFSFKNKDDYDTIKNDFKKYISEGVN
jgi:hypothetical protein